MSNKTSTVAGPGHGMCQRFIAMQSKKQCPKGWRVQIEEEYKFQEGKMRPDVFVQFFSYNKQYKIIYEVQKYMGDKTFQKKIETIRRMIEDHVEFNDQFRGHKVHELIVIQLGKVPDTWKEAYEYIGERILIP